MLALLSLYDSHAAQPLFQPHMHADHLFRAEQSYYYHYYCSWLASVPSHRRRRGGQAELRSKINNLIKYLSINSFRNAAGHKWAAANLIPASVSSSVDAQLQRAASTCDAARAPVRRQARRIRWSTAERLQRRSRKRKEIKSIAGSAFRTLQKKMLATSSGIKLRRIMCLFACAAAAARSERKRSVFCLAEENCMCSSEQLFPSLQCVFDLIHVSSAYATSSEQLFSRLPCPACSKTKASLTLMHLRYAMLGFAHSARAGRATAPAPAARRCCPSKCGIMVMQKSAAVDASHTPHRRGANSQHSDREGEHKTPLQWQSISRVYLCIPIRLGLSVKNCRLVLLERTAFRANSAVLRGLSAASLLRLSCEAKLCSRNCMETPLAALGSP